MDLIRATLATLPDALKRNMKGIPISVKSQPYDGLEIGNEIYDLTDIWFTGSREGLERADALVSKAREVIEDDSLVSVHDLVNNRLLLRFSQPSYEKIAKLISIANSWDIMFLGSSKKCFKKYREIQKKQYYGITYCSIVDSLKSTLDPESILIKDVE